MNPVARKPDHQENIGGNQDIARGRPGSRGRNGQLGKNVSHGAVSPAPHSWNQ